jgi:hypothetical protein
MHVSSLKHLENYERKVREERMAKNAQTRKKNSNSDTTRGAVHGLISDPCQTTIPSG